MCGNDCRNRAVESKKLHYKCIHSEMGLMATVYWPLPSCRPPLSPPPFMSPPLSPQHHLPGWNAASPRGRDLSTQPSFSSEVCGSELIFTPMGCSLELTGDFQTFGLEILLVDVRCGRSKEERRNVFMYKVFFFLFFISGLVGEKQTDKPIFRLFIYRCGQSRDLKRVTTVWRYHIRHLNSW